MEQGQFTPADFSDLVALVYRSAYETPQWDSFLKTIASQFPGVVSVVMGHEGNVIRPTYAVAGPVPPEFLDQQVAINFENRFHDNAMTALLGEPNGFVARSRKFLEPDVYENSDFYKTFMKPFGLHDYINLKLDSYQDRGAFMGFGISVDLPDPVATHDALFRLLVLLAPHCVQAQKQARDLALARTDASALAGFLDAVTMPMLVVDAHAKMRFANSAGQRLLSSGRVFTQSGNGVLRPAGYDQTGEFHRKLRSIERSLAPGGMRVHVDDVQMSLCLVPFLPTGAELNAVDRDLFDREPLCAVFVGQPGDVAIRTDILQDVFELTEREALVCRDMLAGMSPAEIADASGRSLKTIRNQIQVILEKVGVTSTPTLMDALAVFRTVGTMFDE